MKKYSLNDLHTHAKVKGGKCLSDHYEKYASKYLWRCAEGHEWSATWNSIQQGSWCKKCSYKTTNKKTGKESHAILSKMREHALTLGGGLLSNEYINVATLYRWRCAEGHEWNANWNNVQRGSWCKKCFLKTERVYERHRKKPIRDTSEKLLRMREHANNLGGLCLSEIFINNTTKYQWRCALGHEWKQTWSNVFHNDSWCKICSYKHPRKKKSGRQGSLGRRVKFQKFVETVNEKRGIVLSSPEEYKNNKTKIRIKCEKGHQFEAHFNFVQQGGWCRLCRVKVVTINDLRLLAQKFGGILISENYKGVMQKHEWKCSSGHVFQKTPNAVKRGEWCSSCGDKVGERVCRATLEAVFKKPFPTLRPQWLAEGRSRMELDGYNEELGIAFEYHGSQHYEKNYFSKTDEQLKKRQEADQRKRELCKTNNVFLIEIPYKVPVFRIEGYIKRICIENHLENENYIDRHEPIVKKAFLQTNLRRMQEFASLRGGKCLSPAYVHAHHKLEWECGEGHRWEAKPNFIQQGGWCPKCAKHRRAVLMAGRRRKQD